MHGHALLANMAHATSGKQVRVESVMQFVMSTGVIAGDVMTLCADRTR